MDCHQTGNKALPESMFTNPLMHAYASKLEDRDLT